MSTFDWRWLEPAKKTGLALRRACEEHGTPNSFSPGELEGYGAPSAAVQGRVARRMNGIEWVRIASGLLPISYVGRRWCVEYDPSTK